MLFTTALEQGGDKTWPCVRFGWIALTGYKTVFYETVNIDSIKKITNK